MKFEIHTKRNQMTMMVSRLIDRSFNRNISPKLGAANTSPKELVSPRARFLSRRRKPSAAAWLQDKKADRYLVGTNQTWPRVSLSSKPSLTQSKLFIKYRTTSLRYPLPKPRGYDLGLFGSRRWSASSFSPPCSNTAATTCSC